jgi:hypothetical protein
MLDRLFMPALTFTLLVAATAAFAAEFAVDARADEAQVVRLERVVVTAKAQAVPVALAEQVVESTALR